MPYRCVASGCSNVPDASKNIALHKFPSEFDDSEKKRRRLWVNFVCTKRAKWSPTANSRLCSKHFRVQDFDSPFLDFPGTLFSSRMILKGDSVPTIHAADQRATTKNNKEPCASSSTREHSRVSSTLLLVVNNQSIFTNHVIHICVGCEGFAQERCRENQWVYSSTGTSRHRSTGRNYRTRRSCWTCKFPLNNLNILNLKIRTIFVIEIIYIFSSKTSPLKHQSV